MKLLFILLLIRLSFAEIDDGRTFSPVCASVLRSDGKLLQFFVIFSNLKFIISILLQLRVRI